MTHIMRNRYESLAHYLARRMWHRCGAYIVGATFGIIIAAMFAYSL